ncbi:MAG TPA: sugar kinase [Propionibacteriaceae bacterium]|jgi:2-dehydro-3-deoxygluconokinase
MDVFPGAAGPQPYLLTFGETMALMAAEQLGPLAHATSMRIGIGGAESNVAIGAQRLGTQAVWCSRLGDDALGRRVERDIRAEGVDTRVTVDDSAPTGLMIKERRTANAQRVSYYRAGSAASKITLADVGEDRIARAALLHVTGITPALSAQAAATVRAAVAVARAHRVPVSLDFNYRRALWSAADAGAFYRELLPSVDLVFAGEDEAAIAIPDAADAAELARRIEALGPRQVVIKRGAAGAFAVIDGQTYSQPAVAIEAVDTVGAGDAFVAGYLAEYLGQRPPEVRLSTAATVGAFACLVPGDWEGLPTRDELGLLAASDPVTR